MKKLILCLALSVLAGCSANKPIEVQPVEKSPRLFYRDLSVQAVYQPVSEPKQIEGVVSTVPGFPAVTSITAPYFVQFENESTRPKNRNINPGLDMLLDGLDVKASYLIIGHSHGVSSTGIDVLAKERALFVADLLRDVGVPVSNLYLFGSSSSPTDEPFRASKKNPPRKFPALGAQVFKINS